MPLSFTSQNAFLPIFVKKHIWKTLFYSAGSEDIAWYRQSSKKGLEGNKHSSSRRRAHLQDQQIQFNPQSGSWNHIWFDCLPSSHTHTQTWGGREAFKPPRQINCDSICNSKLNLQGSVLNYVSCRRLKAVMCLTNYAHHRAPCPGASQVSSPR